MPSRPVLIGRGLVPTPYKTNHHTPYGLKRNDIPCATKQPHLRVWARVHMQFPTNTPTRRGFVSRSRTPQLNRCIIKLGTPPPTRTGLGSGCVCSARVTAAIAKGKHPVPYRTRKLSLSAPMVLQPRGCGRVGRRRTTIGQRPPGDRWPLLHLSALASTVGSAAPLTYISTASKHPRKVSIVAEERRSQRPPAR